jgi:hypothetical protein
MSSNESWQNRASAQATAALCAAVLLATPGCGAILGVFSGEKQAEARQVELGEQQARVMRFADEFAARVSEAGATVERAVATPDARVELQGWKLGQITSAFIIATGPNPVVNSLDMIVLTTLDHAVVHDHWMPRYGAAVQPLLDAHARLEREAWSMGDQLLTRQQAGELRLMIQEWRRNNPKLRFVGFIHFRDFSKTIGKQPTAGGGPPTLFGLVGLDPLSDLDPAVRELARSRLLAERALFYGQRLPFLLDMQVNHVTYHTAAMPEARQMLANANAVGTSVARVSSTVDDLPRLIERERRAAIDQILQRLEEQQDHARALIDGARGALETGTATATAFDRAIRSLDGLIARFDDAVEPVRGETPSKPFDIDEYAAAAAELSQAARDIERLASTLTRTAPQLDASVRAVAETSQSVIDRAFARALALLALALLGGLGAAVAYKYIALRLQRSQRTS